MGCPPPWVAVSSSTIYKARHAAQVKAAGVQYHSMRIPAPQTAEIKELERRFNQARPFRDASEAIEVALQAIRQSECATVPKRARTAATKPRPGRVPSGITHARVAHQQRL